jgi:hypothetical protein
MRRLDAYRAAWPHQAVEFLHGGHDVRYMLDHVDGQQPVERIVSKGVWKAVEVAKDVGARGGIPVDPDGSWLLVNSAADVQYPQGWGIARVGHSYRVSDVRRRRPSVELSKAGFSAANRGSHPTGISCRAGLLGAGLERPGLRFQLR